MSTVQTHSEALSKSADNPKNLERLISDDDHSDKKPTRRGRGRPPKADHLPKYDKRLQIKLTDEGRDRLDEIVSRVGAAGFGEVVRDALRIYDIITEQVFVQENQIAIRDSKSGKLKKATFFPDVEK